VCFCYIGIAHSHSVPDYLFFFMLFPLFSAVPEIQLKTPNSSD